ncbi:MAG TPA: shikimate dehydrogenase [Microlunatus sp.]|nr:shikimate dehydrogenase [Microlunatus sp.]
MTGRPYLVGLIGAGVGPSLTPPLHVAEARALGLDYVYRTIDIASRGIDPHRVGDLVAAARVLGYDALNITHPCKQLVVEHLHDLDERAARLGAVNTVIFTERGAIGHNTDTTGFAAALRTGLPGAATAEVVQLGAGGGGAAVADALLRGGTGHLTLVDVDRARAERLAEALASHYPDARVDGGGQELLAGLVPGADGLVHCTPTGMVDHPGLPLDPQLLHAHLWVADIVYRPLATPLLRAARAVGARTLDGGRMAVHQAAQTLALVTGRQPDVERMFATFSRLLDDERADVTR